MEPLSLRELLMEHLAAGTLPPARVLAALAAVAPADPESPPSLLQLLAALDQQPRQSQALTSLRHDVVTGLVRAAQEVHALRELKPFLRLMRDHNYLAQQASELVGTA